VSCLVLFGDAGMGKSAELEEDFQRHQIARRHSFLLDLGGSDTWAEARGRLLSSREVVAWLAGAGEQLVLLVDSVDEVSRSMRKLTDQLLDLLDELPCDRLLLRVAGRSAAFPSRLRDGLRARFGDCRELNLAPLTLRDVEQAAAVTLKDGDVPGFVTALTERDIGVLASRPITLDMLMQLYGEGPLPTGRIKLYRRAIRRLVRETSQRRLDESAAHIPVTELTETAQVLAAVSILCGRSSIAVSRYPEMPEGQLSLDEVTWRGDKPEVFTEVTRSALFAAAAGKVVRWTHRDFPEFLTAQCLARMEAGDAIALLADPDDPGKIVPQLAGTAVWAALLSTELFGRLVSIEPELLLTSSLADAKPGMRRLLLQALLASMKDRPPGDWYRYYRWLDYTGLPGDVEPYLSSDMPRWLHREVAWILSETGHHELDARLAEIVETVASSKGPAQYDDEVRLATAVVACLRGSEDPGVQDRLHAIAADAGAPRTLRAAIFTDMWRIRPAGDVLGMLTASGTDGGDRGFAVSAGPGLADAIHQHDAEVSAVTDWLAANGVPASVLDEAADGDEERPAEEWLGVLEACMLIAAGSPGKLSDEQWKRLAAVYSSLIPHIDDPFRWRRDEIAALPAAGRHRAISEILQAAPGRAAAHFLVQARLIRRDDASWVLRQYSDAAAGSDLADSYRFAAQLTCPPTPENRDLADELFSAQKIAGHAQALAAELRRASDTRDRQSGFTREQLAAALETRDWPAAAAELRKPDRSRKRLRGTPMNTSPGWHLLTPAEQAAVLELALDHLAGNGASASGPALPGDSVDACALLASADPRRLDALNPAILAPLLPALLGMPRQHQASAVLIEKLSSVLPDHVERAVIQAIEYDLTRGHPFGIDRIGTYTSPAVTDVLDRVARDPAATAYVVHGALRALLERDEPRGSAAVLEVLRRRPGGELRPAADNGPGAEARRRWDQAAAAAAALTRSPALGIRLDGFLREMSSSDEFAADVIAWTDHAGHGRRAWEALSADQKADLLVWARRNLPQEPDLPPGQDPDIEPVHMLPRRILALLASDVSQLSAAALHRAADELDDPWLRREAEKLTAAVREAGWAPLAPHEVREVLEHPHKRVITSEAQLARVLLDGLDAVASDIGQDTNHRAAYWHRQYDPKGTYIPADEPEFMAQLSWHLSTLIRGVSLRSEVELNHRLADVAGSEADIEAIARDGEREICVIIEGKGIWHPKVRTAIKTQLHNRYLTGAHSHTGIYLVAAYSGELWLQADSRRAKAARRDVAKLRAHLAGTAKQLTVPPRAIHVRVMDIPLNPRPPVNPRKIRRAAL
jgi:hypothetical protein